MCTCSISYRTVTVMSTVNQLILGIEHGILSEIGTKQGYTGWNPLTFLCDTVQDLCYHFFLNKQSLELTLLSS